MRSALLYALAVIFHGRALEREAAREAEMSTDLENRSQA